MSRNSSVESLFREGPHDFILAVLGQFWKLSAGRLFFAQIAPVPAKGRGATTEYSPNRAYVPSRACIAFPNSDSPRMADSLRPGAPFRGILSYKGHSALGQARRLTCRTAVCQPSDGNTSLV